MDPLQHLCAKIAAEQTYQSLRPQHPAPSAIAPPAYTPADTDAEDDHEDDEEPSPSPLKLTINAAHSIQGSNNLVPTSPTPLADATKFSTLLLAAVNQIHSVAQSSDKGRRAVKVDLTINCGITVIGDRNVVGNVGLKPKVGANATAGPGARAGSSPPPVTPSSDMPTVAGAKRMRDDDSNGEEEPETKRFTVHHGDSD